MAVTFTNKAANEMKHRLKTMNVSNEPTVGTFHSIGNIILRFCPETAGVRTGFTIMDTDDTHSLWKKIFLVPEDEIIQPGDYRMHKSDEHWETYMRTMFKWKEKGLREGLPKGKSNFENDISRLFDIYEPVRKEQNRVDFHDLISASLLAIKENPKGISWSSRFTHVLVDEFQDTSDLQFQWATAILKGEKKKQNLFCVGDDNQSIYAFRGANIKNIYKFVRDYSAQEILLEQNYRCGSHILDAANNLIAKNENGDKKKLWTENATGDVSVENYATDTNEAEEIARQIKTYKYPLTNVAILVRTKSTMVPISHALRSKGIEHHIVGAKDFFDSKEVRDGMALVKFSLNHNDMVSFERAAGLFKGIGKRAISNLIDEARQYQMPYLDACKSDKKFKVIYDAFDGIDEESDAFEAVFKMTNESGLRKLCEKAEGGSRISNLNDFCELAGQFTNLKEFVEEMTLFADRDVRQSGVTISTIHAAKGLEWERVYLPVLTNDHLPRIEGNDYVGMTDEQIHEEMEEFRRLMYVAITRAKHDLYISYPSRRMEYGKLKNCSPSCFLGEAGLFRESTGSRYDHSPEYIHE